jgi:hypothetical protein
MYIKFLSVVFLGMQIGSCRDGVCLEKYIEAGPPLRMATFRAVKGKSDQQSFAIRLLGLYAQYYLAYELSWACESTLDLLLSVHTGLKTIAGGDLLEANVEPCLEEVKKNVNYFYADRTTLVGEEESLYYTGILSRAGNIGKDCLYLLYKTQTGKLHPRFPKQVHLNYYVNDISFKYELSHERLMAITDTDDKHGAAMDLISLYSQCYLIIHFTNDNEMHNLLFSIRERFSSFAWRFLSLVDVGPCINDVNECVSEFISAHAGEKNLAKLVHDVRPIAWDYIHPLHNMLFFRSLWSAVSGARIAPLGYERIPGNDNCCTRCDGSLKCSYLARWDNDRTKKHSD